MIAALGVRIQECGQEFERQAANIQMPLINTVDAGLWHGHVANASMLCS